MILNKKEVCKCFFKIEDMDGDILVGKRRLLWRKMRFWIGIEKVIYVWFIEKSKES